MSQAAGSTDSVTLVKNNKKGWPETALVSLRSKAFVVSVKPGDRRRLLVRGKPDIKALESALGHGNFKFEEPQASG